MPRTIVAAPSFVESLIYSQTHSGRFANHAHFSTINTPLTHCLLVYIKSMLDEQPHLFKADILWVYDK